MLTSENDYSDKCLELARPLFEDHLNENTNESMDICQNNPENDSKTIFKALSWNLEGLNAQLLEQRTEFAITEIINESPDVILLQEVLNCTEGTIRKRLECDYAIFSGNNVHFPSYYYTLILVKKASSTILNHSVIPFQNSTMGRTLNALDCTIHDVHYIFLCSHLESTDSSTATLARKEQLKYSWDFMLNRKSDENILFGGDLNLNSWEIPELGGVPDGILDIWESTGSRMETKATWDTTINFNAKQICRASQKIRYDRFYFRPDSQKSLKPIRFELIGLNNLPHHTIFPSDHWGILAHFGSD